MAVISTDLDFTSDFVQIPNAWMRDKRLSRRARGLLAELMTHRGGWQTTTQQMVANGPEGRDAVQTALAELAKYGYLRLERIRAEGGRMGGSHYHLQAPPGDGFPGPRSVSGDREPGSPGNWKSATKNTNVQEDHLEEDHAPASRKQRARRLPDTWEPNATHQAKAAEKNLDLAHEAETFRNHAQAHDRRLVDWDAGFRNWLTKAKPRPPQGRRNDSWMNLSSSAL